MTKTKEEANNWPEEIRLKMIEKSKFYPEEEKVYQFGYYDGYQEASTKTAILYTKEEVQKIVENVREAVINEADGTIEFDEMGNEYLVIITNSMRSLDLNQFIKK